MSIKNNVAGEIKAADAPCIKYSVAPEIKAADAPRIKDNVAPEIKSADARSIKCNAAPEVKAAGARSIKCNAAREIKAVNVASIKCNAAREIKVADARSIKCNVAREIKGVDSSSCSKKSIPCSDTVVGGRRQHSTSRRAQPQTNDKKSKRCATPSPAQLKVCWRNQSRARSKDLRRATRSKMMFLLDEDSICEDWSPASASHVAPRATHDDGPVASPLSVALRDLVPEKYESPISSAACDEVVASPTTDADADACVAASCAEVDADVCDDVACAIFEYEVDDGCSDNACHVGEYEVDDCSGDAFVVDVYDFDDCRGDDVYGFDERAHLQELCRISRPKRTGTATKRTKEPEKRVRRRIQRLLSTTRRFEQSEKRSARAYDSEGVDDDQSKDPDFWGDESADERCEENADNDWREESVDDWRKESAGESSGCCCVDSGTDSDADGNLFFSCCCSDDEEVDDAEFFVDIDRTDEFPIAFRSSNLCKSQNFERNRALNDKKRTRPQWSEIALKQDRKRALILRSKWRSATLSSKEMLQDEILLELHQVDQSVCFQVANCVPLHNDASDFETEAHVHVSSAIVGDEPVFGGGDAEPANADDDAEPAVDDDAEPAAAQKPAQAPVSTRRPDLAAAADAYYSLLPRQRCKRSKPAPISDNGTSVLARQKRLLQKRQATRVRWERDTKASRHNGW